MSVCVDVELTLLLPSTRSHTPYPNLRADPPAASWFGRWASVFLTSNSRHPWPCPRGSEQSRSTADNALKLSMTSRNLVSLKGPHGGGGNLSWWRCNRQLPRILIGIMYHWLAQSSVSVAQRNPSWSIQATHSHHISLTLFFPKTWKILQRTTE